MITEPEIRFSAKANARKILFAVEIPLPLLKEWRKIINEEASNREGTSGENSVTGSEDEQARLRPSTSQDMPYRKKQEYIDLLEYSVPCGLFPFTDNQAVRDEISVHLMKLSNAVVHLYRTTRGRARKELDEKVKKIHVYEGQTKSVRELYDEIEFMTDEIEEWKSKHKHLEEEKERLYEDFVVALNEHRRVSEELQKSNKELEEHVKTLEETIGITSHKGKVVSGTTNKTRTLKSFLSRVETALWFSKSLGLPWILSVSKNLTQV